MRPVEPKRHHNLHLRPPDLLKRLRVQHQQVTLPLRPVEHHAQADPVVLVFPIRIRQEYGLARRLGVDDSRGGRLRQGVVFDQSVEEGGVAAVADAVDVAAGLGGVEGVEGREFGRVFFRGGESSRDFAGGTRGGYLGTADVGELEAGKRRFARCAFPVHVVERSGCRPFHVVVVEALEDVEVWVGGDVGDDVHLPRFRFRGLLPRVDGVESEEWIRFIYPHEALAVPSVDYKPEVLLVRVEVHGF